MTAAPAMSQLARLLGAPEEELRSSWGDLMGVRWTFWSFSVVYNGNVYATSPAGDSGPEDLYLSHTVRGVADEIRRRHVQFPVGYEWWNVVASPDIVGDRVRDVKFFLTGPHWDHYLAGPGGRATFPTAGIGATGDLAGRDVALGAMYHRHIQGLVDYLIETPRYEAEAQMLEAAWLNSVHAASITE